MKIVDARSGQVLVPGQPVAWGDGQWIRLDRVLDQGILKARAVITTQERNPYGIMVHRTSETDLQVRWTHPAFFLQHVAFVPS